MQRLRRLAVPLGIYLLTAAVYVAMLGDRRLEHSPDDHFVHLAASFLEGRLDQGGNPPGRNDWACYDTVEHGACPAGVFTFPPSQFERYRWYVSFPPAPAWVILPAVAAFGEQLPDRLFWALLAGFGPTSLFSLLRSLRARGHSSRSAREDLGLTLLFAFGSVYFFTAVQGTVWFAAHVTSVPLACLFLASAVDARRPVLAGVAIGLLFLTRPTTSLFGLFFVAEALRIADTEPALGWLARLRALDVGLASRRLLAFAVPCSVAIGFALWFNWARFEDPTVFGHEYLQIVWQGRIEKWGLFNYHFVAKNLSVFVAGLPWLSRNAPYLTISGHGLALWVTTPAVLLAFFPRVRAAPMPGLAFATVLVLVLNLMYQNSGWIQFGYRFALDYLPAVFVLLALGARPFAAGFRLLFVWALVVNTFGAVTFDRVPRFYHVDPSQNVLFQPD